MTRHRRTPGRHSAALAEASFNEVSVISFKGAQAGVEKFPLRDDDDVGAVPVTGFATGFTNNACHV